MYNYYDIDILPIILNKFKVNQIVACGMSDNETLTSILEYCDLNELECIIIDSKVNVDREFIDDIALNVLPDLSNYDAIFLDDDPNWYTIYNELNIIKKNNDEFPLVFICNNIFPHKRRDSYKDPNLIPKEFRQEYSKEFDYGGISLYDDFYHAIEDNTSKNGVLTAIEDFLNENSSIEVMNIKLVNGITILYPNNNISKIRLGLISEEIEGNELKFEELQDNIIENQLLTNYLSKLNKYDKNINIEDILDELIENRKIIDNYEDKMELQYSEIAYKNSQIESVDSKLSLKDAQINNIESKLVNSENKIYDLTNELKIANTQINSLKKEVSEKEQSLLNKEMEFDTKINEANSQISSLRTNLSQVEQRELTLSNQLLDANNHIKENIEQLNYKTNHLRDKDNQIKNQQNEIKDKDDKLNSIKQQYISQLSKLNNKDYCITCYKDEITNNHLEIEYLKKDNLIKKFLSPLAYIYLIFKSKPKELSLNFKLYKALKNSKCFDIGFYLNNNRDIRGSKWCKYFSPELHYVCNGFDEERKFNKKYFNRDSKKELLDYLKLCNYE